MARSSARRSSSSVTASPPLNRITTTTRARLRKDKVAVALAGTPDGDNPHGKFTRSGEVRFKAAAARAAGARALVLIAGENNFKDDKLSRLAYDNAGGDAGIPVVVISRQVAARASGVSVPQLAEFEKKFREWKSSTQAMSATSAHDATLNLKVPEGVSLNLSTDIVRKNAPAANVVGVLEGSDPRLKNEVIVVGAHYDHLGRGGRSSLAGREGDVHHGADDNASGTAALLELARVLSAERTKLRRTVVFIAFGGEEEGLLGSSHYVNHPARPLEQTVAMINMDMVGRLREGALMVGGVGTAAEWRALLVTANTEHSPHMADAHGASQPEAGGSSSSQASNYQIQTPVETGDEKKGVTGDEKNNVAGKERKMNVETAGPAARFNLRLNEDGFGPSDHSSFYAKRVPVLFFFTGSHEDYHKPSDTADRINYDGLASIAEFVRLILSDLQTSDKRPTFAVAKVEQTARSTGFRVYLGTVPSYGESTDGMNLDAVREGSPAEKAGLKAGDRIVKMAGRDVRNVYDYTQALSEMKAGEEYEVEVVRAGQRLMLKVTPAARSKKAKVKRHKWKTRSSVLGVFHFVPFAFLLLPSVLPAGFAVASTAPAAIAATVLVTPAAVAAAAAAVGARARFVDRDVAPVELRAVELLDGRRRALGRSHLDKAEAARAARVAILDDRGRRDLARLREQLAQFLARRAEIEVSDVKSHAHLFTFLCWKGKKRGRAASGAGCVEMGETCPTTFATESGGDQSARCSNV